MRVCVRACLCVCVCACDRLYLFAMPHEDNPLSVSCVCVYVCVRACVHVCDDQIGMYMNTLPSKGYSCVHAYA